LKILMLAWNYPPAVGGIEYVAFHLGAGLRELGHQVEVLSRWAAETDAAEVGVHRAGGAGLLRYLVFSLPRAIRTARATRAEVIVAAGVVDAPVAWLASRLCRVPYVLLAHGSDLVYRGGLYRRLVQALFRHAARVRANSNHTGELLIEGGCDPERVSVIHPGVDPSAVVPCRAEALHGFLETQGWQDRRLILSVGRVVKRKGFLEFVEQVLPRLVEKDPRILYVIAGGDPVASLVHRERLVDLIRERADALGLSEHVAVMGSVTGEVLNLLYRASELFVLPVLESATDVEGFGIVFLEGALAELPSVSTRTGGIRDAVSDGRTGLLADPGDWDGIYEAVSLLLADRARAAEMGRAGRERVMGSFLWSHIARQYEMAIREAAPARDADGC
jgi:phosphatidylinositol alpha-1,6-mannosyltransferase